MNSINLHKNTTLYIISATAQHSEGHSTKKQRAVKEADMRAKQTGEKVTVHTESGLAAGKAPVYTAEPPAAKINAEVSASRTATEVPVRNVGAPVTSNAVVEQPKPAEVIEAPKPVKKPVKPIAITHPKPTKQAEAKRKEYTSKFVGNGGKVWDAPESFEKRGFVRKPSLGPSKVEGWEVLYDTPKKQEQLLRANDRAEYAFYCTATDENGEAHDTFRPINSQSEAKAVGRTAWCDKCGVKKASKKNLVTA